MFYKSVQVHFIFLKKQFVNFLLQFGIHPTFPSVSSRNWKNLTLHNKNNRLSIPKSHQTWNYDKRYPTSLKRNPIPTTNLHFTLSQKQNILISCTTNVLKGIWFITTKISILPLNVECIVKSNQPATRDNEIFSKIFKIYPLATYFKCVTNSTIRTRTTHDNNTSFAHNIFCILIYTIHLVYPWQMLPYKQKNTYTTDAAHKSPRT